MDLLRQLDRIGEEALKHADLIHDNGDDDDDDDYHHHSSP